MNEKIISIYIPGEPVAKGRGRHATLPNGRKIVYTPKKTANWESVAKHYAKQSMGDMLPMGGPLQLSIVLVFEIPKSWPKWKKAAAIFGEVAHTGKPDIDNCMKAVKDAFNGVVWIDDSQVIKADIEKYYSDHAMVSAVVKPIIKLPSSISKRPADLMGIN